MEQGFPTTTRKAFAQNCGKYNVRTFIIAGIFSVITNHEVIKTVNETSLLGEIMIMCRRLSYHEAMRV